MSSARSLMLLGGPATGKTTYLGALVDALQNETVRHLRLDGLADDARGLQQLADPLLGGMYPQRTKSAERIPLVAPLRTAGDYFESTAFTLSAGDYDGEEVERLFRDRIHGWTDEWKQRALADGLLLLVRPQAVAQLPRLQPPPEVDEASRWERLHREEKQAAAPRVGRSPATPQRPETIFGAVSIEEVVPPRRAAPTDPVAVPTAFATIELLQFIRRVRGLDPGERPRGEKRLRIALIVTAWDSVDPHWRQAGPARYLSEQLPLLEDFLWSNFHADDVFRFGLSATGGDLRNPEYSQRYLENPGGFVGWRDGMGLRTHRDIGLPIYWLLFGDRALGAP